MPRCLMAKKWKGVPYEKGKPRGSLPTYPTITTKNKVTTKPTKNGRLCLNPTNGNVKNSTKVLVQVQKPNHQHNEATVSNNMTTGNKGFSTRNNYATQIISNSSNSNSSNGNCSDTSSVLSPAGTKPTPSTTANGHHWGPSSPTEGATAPSPPPSWLPAPTAGKATVLFNGYVQVSPSYNGSSSPIHTQDEPEVTNMDSNNKSTMTLIRYVPQLLKYNCLPPPKKRELYRPYCLPESIAAVQQEKMRLHSVCSTLFERKPEDLTTARAILDLSTSSPLLPRRPLNPPPIVVTSEIPNPPPVVTIPQLPTSESPPNENNWTGTSRETKPTLISIPEVSTTPATTNQAITPQQQPLSTLNTNTRQVSSPISEDSTHSSSESGISGTAAGGKTISYTYEAFFISDGRSKKKGLTTTASSAALDVATLTSTPKENVNHPEVKYSGIESDSDSCSATSTSKTRYTCSECGKHYATSSNLSRHKQTHRSLDSQSAKRCPTCGKAYVSMPALAMHILTHNLHHACEVCGKAFSRPWLLQGHLRSHTGEKPYGCAHCGKAFADRSNLRAHMQTHSSAKNYTCSRCKKSFALKSYLNKHYDSACFKECPSPGDGDSELSCDQMNGLEEEEEMEEGEESMEEEPETPEGVDVTLVVTS